MDHSPKGMIARLDAALARRGQDVKLRRYVSGSDVDVDLIVRTVIRGFAAEQLVGAVKSTDSSFVLSPTGLASPVWPGAAGGPAAPQIGDFLVVDGRERRIEAVQPVVVDGVTVRFDGTISGQG